MFDCAGGSLTDLVDIAGDPAHVVTIADLGAAAHGVHLSVGVPVDKEGAPLRAGADALAVHGLAIGVTLAGAGRLQIPIAAAFPLAEAAAAHELSEGRHARGKTVLVN